MINTDQPAPGPQSAESPGEEEAGPARAMTLHLLQMLETRMDAAGIALQTEAQTFSSRLQLRLLAAGAMFIGIWAAIVLLAIALPEHLRIPVLSGVVAAFIIGAVWAQLAAKRRVASGEIGSMSWFLHGLKLDLEVLSRSLHRAKSKTEPTSGSRNPPNDLAA